MSVCLMILVIQIQLNNLLAVFSMFLEKLHGIVTIHLFGAFFLSWFQALKLIENNIANQNFICHNHISQLPEVNNNQYVFREKNAF